MQPQLDEAAALMKRQIEQDEANCKRMQEQVEQDKVAVTHLKAAVEATAAQLAAAKQQAAAATEVANQARRAVQLPEHDRLVVFLVRRWPTGVVTGVCP